MKFYLTQQFEQRHATIWQLFVLLLLFNSLAFTGWVDSRHLKTSSNSNVVADFNHTTFANLRDNYRSLFNVKNLSVPKSSDGDSQHHWLVSSNDLSFPFSALINAENFHYLTLYIIDNIKYQLHLTRAPPLK
ncbi:hypothetical protein LCGC14_0635630 [marine sediment metagenome]|uniref:Uncharacterized protein n=1 Tax=marine sediment metagenome TaxID=412755 RepID=A0A0F9U910_9ZZZZ|nr:hypothetical protein [Methylophaga sp.]